jgi:4'-phosphopantetheinyl transferase
MAFTPSRWSPYSPAPSLRHDEVHVARLQVDDAATRVPALEAILTPDEVNRAAAFHFVSDRERYVLARGCLRIILARYLGSSPGELRFESNRYGKPMLAGASHPGHIHFNVSHSAPLVVFAFSLGRWVGVDVERIREDLPYGELAARFFSPAELRALRSRPTEERLAHFFDTWTHKEAYVKGRGLGLSIPPERFSVAVGGDAAHPVRDSASSSDASSWVTIGIDVGDGYAAALAVEDGEWHLRCFEALDLLESGTEAAAAVADDAPSGRPEAEPASS